MSCKRCSIVGVNDDEGPPVPIPNTVVKLIGVENTWREAAREDRSMPTLKTVTFTVTVFYFLMVSLGVEKNPQFYRGKKNGRNDKKRAGFMQARLMLKTCLKLSHSTGKIPIPVHGLQCV